MAPAGKGETLEDRGLPRLRPEVRSWIELAGAGAIAIAWPVFQNATSGPDAFTRIRADQLDLILFGLLVTLVLPTVLLLVETLIGLASNRWARVFHAIALGALFGLLLIQAMSGAGPLLSTVIWIAAGGTIALIWLRATFVQTMATIFGLALPVTLIFFWFVGPGFAVMAGEPSVSPSATGSEGPPVVMLVLDEFPLVALVKHPGEIDESLFPGFAALARESDWYAGARTAADETVGALPALLSGQTPDSGQTPPASHNYPENLFTRLTDVGYRVNAREQVTDLCPHSLCHDRGSRKKRMALIARNGLEYGALRPVGISRYFDRRLAPEATRGKLTQATLSADFREQLDLRPGSFEFLHLLLPHVPWTLLPAGQTYSNPYLDGLHTVPKKSYGVWAARRGLIDSSFQRFMLQARYIDREISKLTSRLKRENAWEETLLVVVADHGTSFAAGSSRRYLTEGNSGWILPVPLFVKEPGQTRGQTIKRSFSMAGLPALILETLRLERPDGMPGAKENRIAATDTVTARSTIHGEMKLPEAQVQQQFEAARAYRNATFAGDSLFATGGYPNLLGVPVDRAGLTPLATAVRAPWPLARIEPGQTDLPAYVSGQVDSERCPAAIALSLNGRIAATTRPWQESGICRFATVISPDLLHEGENLLNSHSLD